MGVQLGRSEMKSLSCSECMIGRLHSLQKSEGTFWTAHTPPLALGNYLEGMRVKKGISNIFLEVIVKPVSEVTILCGEHLLL